MKSRSTETARPSQPERSRSGAIETSEALLRALRLCESVAAVIPRRRGRKQKPVLRTSAVEALEREIGARLDGDVLTLVAVGDPIAMLVTGVRSLASIAEAAEGPEGPAGWVRIATAPRDGFAEVLDGARTTPSHLCVPASGGRDGRILVLPAGQETTLASFLDDRIAIGLEGRRAVRVPKSDRVPLALEPAPRLVGARTEGAPEARVRHPRFGVGTVLRRLGEGTEAKLVVAFEAGERTLLARFVQTVP